MIKTMPDRFPFMLLKPLAAACIALLASAGALATAYISQYAFGFYPCTLCHWQRVPLWLVIVAALLMLVQGRRTARVWLMVIAALFAVEAGIAAFHVGVEQHWWAGTSSCSVAESTGNDAAALREQLLGTPVARCDEITWRFLGLSMATWNVPFSLMLMVWMLFAARRSDAR